MKADGTPALAGNVSANNVHSRKLAKIYIKIKGERKHMEQILELKKKYFPGKNMAQVMTLMETYYKTDVSSWSDEKLVLGMKQYIIARQKAFEAKKA